MTLVLGLGLAAAPGWGAPKKADKPIPHSSALAEGSSDAGRPSLRRAQASPLERPPEPPASTAASGASSPAGLPSVAPSFLLADPSGARVPVVSDGGESTLASASPSSVVVAPAPSSTGVALTPIAPPEVDRAAQQKRERAEQAERQRGILRVLVGLGVTVLLAIFASHPKVRSIENRFGLTIAVASGLPFVVLGAVFQDPRVNVLDANVLLGLAPFIEFGLGWVGFYLGMGFDVRKLDDIPDGIGAAATVETLVPFAMTSALGVVAFYALGAPWSDGTAVRDALVIGGCASVSAASTPLAVGRGASTAVARLLDWIAMLDDVAPLLVLLFIGAWFRPVTNQLWQLPAIAWLFLTVGIGGVLGMLSYTLIRGARNDKEELAFTLGSVAFSAGIAGRLALSPLVVCAVAGALLANLPRRRDSQLATTLRTVERPVILLFMLFAGATATFHDWHGWALTGVFLAMRVLGKLIGIAWARRVGPSELRKAPGIELAMMTQSSIAISTILAASAMYGTHGRDTVLGWIFTAVIAGSFINDVAVQLVAQRFNRLSTATIDEAAAASIRPSRIDLADLRRAPDELEVTDIATELSAPVHRIVPRYEPKIPRPPLMPSAFDTASGELETIGGATNPPHASRPGSPVDPAARTVAASRADLRPSSPPKPRPRGQR